MSSVSHQIDNNSTGYLLYFNNKISNALSSTIGNLLPFFLKGRKNFLRFVALPHKHEAFSFLQQKGVADFHKNCFLSPVKSNDAIVKNFFFLNWYAQGEYGGVKKILIRAVINSGINKQNLGL